jgi:hypothetical protein
MFPKHTFVFRAYGRTFALNARKVLISRTGRTRIRVY